MGEQQVKNIEQPVRTYHARVRAGAELPKTSAVAGSKRIPRTRLAAIAAVVVIAVVGIGLAWLKPWQPDTEPASVERMAFPLPEKPSIVVLPFDNLSGDPEQEYFVDGLTEDIITDLTRYPDFFVIARHSSFAYKNKAVKAQQVAEELGVQYLVEGSIQRTSKQFRITAQLIDALTGRHVWADRYDVPLEDALVARDEVVRSLVATFPSQIERAESARASRRETENLSAHELVYRGWYHWRKFTKADNAESGRLFAKAVELDPGFDRAYRGLAWFHAHEFEHRWGEDPEASLELAFANAQKALSISPGHYGNHWVLGVIYLYRKQFEQALAAYDKALELNPNDASLLASSTEPLVYMGKANEALEHLQRAMRLNPFHPQWYEAFLGMAYFEDRQYENTVKTLEPLVASGLPSTHIRLAASYAYLGQMDKAQAHAAQVLEKEPDFSMQRFAQSRSYKEPSDLDHFLVGLRKAGLPEYGSPPLPDKPSIAVLPFDNLSGDPEKEYMADGMSEHIISSLARIPEMFVVAKNSTFFYKDKAVDVRQVAEELGVQYVLEGSLQTSGERIRITAQFIDALSGLHVWSEQYDRSLDDFFALQDDITHNIAVALLAELAKGERAIIEAQTTTDLKAWLLYQQASEEYRTFSKDGNAQARKIFREAVEQDPNYALAWTFLGWTHFIDARLGYSASRAESLKLANEMADKAASIYPELPDLYLLRAYIHMVRGELDEAIELGQKVLDAAPGHATYYAGNSQIMLHAGNFDASIEFMNKAIRLSPRYPAWYDLILGRAYAMKRDYESSQSTFFRLLGNNPSPVMAAGGHTGLALIYNETGRDDQARAEVVKATELVPWLSLAFYRNLSHSKDPAHWERFETALRKAGLPE